MSDPKSRALPYSLSLYFIMLSVYCADIFFLKSDLTVLGDNFYARFFSFVILMMLVLFKQEHLKTYGISNKKEKFRDGLVFGTLFSVVPIAIVSAAELIIFRIYSPSRISLGFATPNISFVKNESYLTPLFCIVVYFLTTFFAACFKETFFRGFLLHKFEKLTTFHPANFFQALLYMTFILPKLIRNFGTGYYGEGIVELAVYVVLFYIIHEIITGLKWGLLSNVGESVYISIIDNTLYVFLANSIQIISPSSNWVFFIFMLSTQLISFAFVWIYCKHQKLVKAQKEAAELDQKLKKVKKDEKKPVYTAELVEKEEQISPDSFKRIIREATGADPKMNETEIDDFLKDFGKPAHKPKKQAAPIQTTALDPDNFDVDDFLKGYKK